MGYKNKTLRLDLGDLADEPLWIDILNPRMLSQQSIDMPDLPDDATEVDKINAGMEAIAKIIVAWNLFDVEDEDDPPTVLPIPSVDLDSLRKVPGEVINRLGEEMKGANPPTPSTPNGG